MDQDPDSDDYDSDMDPEDFDEEDEDESMDDEEAAGKITELPEPTNGKRSAETSTEELSKSQKKKLNKKLKGESGEAAPAPAVEEKKAAAPAAKAAAAPAPKAEAKSNKKVHGNGLVTEDSKLGTGAVAKSGKKVGMRYIGKLANGKVFDSNTNGKPFVFVLGKGEVIKGWDLGVAGMAIGGERKLTIPAPLAYGSKALPGIPKNSTLHFEVKLVSVQ
jgi:FK506-binding nuclear protein